MNASDRWELERLKQRYATLEKELALLGEQLKKIEARLKTSETAPASSAAQQLLTKISGEQPPAQPTPPSPPFVPPVISPLSTPPPVAAPVESTPARESTPEPVETEKTIKCICKSCGTPLEFPAMMVGDTVRCPSCNQPTFLVMETRPAAEVPPVFPTPPPAPPPFEPPPPPPRSAGPPPVEQRSLEMRFGTYWAVRIGIVLVLTALVFFGNYAYQNWIGKLGPGGKVSLLYFASAALLGAGAWWQRKAAKESLKNYAQVLFAGGLAAVYFTTYAAHHFENLRVISSALLDGAFLFCWAGFIVWIADRKKSELLALFAIGLAYYTSVITRVESFTLYSNLVLTIAAVFFLVRNRWATLSFASLVATYSAYGFWRFYDGGGWHWASPEQGLWFGTGFLISYWIVFTGAVFLSRDDRFAGVNRATFATLNNAAFFVMFLLTMLQVRHGGFWKFAMGYGAALLACAELARWILPKEPLTKNSYLTQGLLLVTVGLVAKFTGLKLALLLGAESVVLLNLGLMRNSWILQAGAYVCGVLATGWAAANFERADFNGLYLGSAVGALMAANAFRVHRRTITEPAIIRPVVACFTVLALAIWMAATWVYVDRVHVPLVLGVEALVLTASIYLLRVREFALFGQAFLLVGQIAWLLNVAGRLANETAHTPVPEDSFLWVLCGPVVPLPWWNPALLIAISLALAHWWPRQKVITGGSQFNWFWQGVYALAIVGILYFWLEPRSVSHTWVVWSSLLAVGITVYGLVTRAWLLAFAAQIFVGVSVVQFAIHLFRNWPEWHLPLAPIAALGLLSVATVEWFRRRPQGTTELRDSLLQLAMIYRWVALAMSIGWVCDYIPARERIWVFAVLGFTVFVLAGWRRNSEALTVGAVLTLAGFALFWVPLEASTVYLPNLFAILLLLVQQRIARRLPDRYKLDANTQGAMIALGGLSVWMLLYRWTYKTSEDFYITASWAGLALVFFICGFVLRERVYRWLGLTVLAAALCHVVLFDVWKLEALYRILSFMALGVVLLVLGFVYNKYQEKFKEWL